MTRHIYNSPFCTNTICNRNKFNLQKKNTPRIAFLAFARNNQPKNHAATGNTLRFYSGRPQTYTTRRVQSLVINLHHRHRGTRVCSSRLFCSKCITQFVNESYIIFAEGADNAYSSSGFVIFTVQSI